MDILEAAHIMPYKGIKDNHAENGLLLRSDIHTLFDLDLIGINPDDLTIHLHESIRNSEYELFYNTFLRSCRKNIMPSKKALSNRWKKFVARN
jgi:predicted restriction endonuclease